MNTKAIVACGPSINRHKDEIRMCCSPIAINDAIYFEGLQNQNATAVCTHREKENQYKITGVKKYINTYKCDFLNKYSYDNRMIFTIETAILCAVDLKAEYILLYGVDLEGNKDFKGEYKRCYYFEEQAKRLFLLTNHLVSSYGVQFKIRR